MTTGKAFNGKPYVRNPHVRFDEGEVSSCTAETSVRTKSCRTQPDGRVNGCASTPRHASLFYMGCVKLAIVGFATALCGFETVSKPAYDTLISHRGESFDAPENTLPAYKMAVEHGFGFECDIYLSADKRLFTFHDSDLKRTTAGANTNACTAVRWDNTISKVNVGGWGKWKGSKFDPTRPALLDEVLALARPGRKIYVEVKGDNPEWVPYIKEVFAKEPKATPDTVLFIAFGGKMCAELKRQMPEYKTYWLTWSRRGWGKDAPAITLDYVLSKLKETGADGVDCHFNPDIITADFISSVKSAGFEFHVWTIDDPKTAEEAFRRGSETVTTNRAKFILDSFEGR